MLQGHAHTSDIVRRTWVVVTSGKELGRGGGGLRQEPAATGRKMRCLIYRGPSPGLRVWVERLGNTIGVSGMGKRGGGDCKEMG